MNEPSKWIFSNNTHTHTFLQCKLTQCQFCAHVCTSTDTHTHTQLVPEVAVGAEIGKKMANVSVCDRQPEAEWGTAQLSDRCCHHNSVTSSSPQHTACMLGSQECTAGE